MCKDTITVPDGGGTGYTCTMIVQTEVVNNGETTTQTENISFDINVFNKSLMQLEKTLTNVIKEFFQDSLTAIREFHNIGKN